MSTWYQPTVKYGSMVEGKYKLVSEQYLFRCVSLTDLEATVTTALSSRIKNLDIDSFSKPRPSDVYKMTEGPISEVEGDFYLVKVACDFGDSKTIDKHIVNADTPAQAETRVRERLKNVSFDFEITHSDKTKILGIYDPDNVVWLDDFEQRMEDLEAQGKKEANYGQEEIFNKDGSAKTSSDSSTALVVRNQVEEVEAQDLGNDYEPNTDSMRPVYELPVGRDSETDQQTTAKSPKPKNPKGRSRKGKLSFFRKNGELADG